MQGCYGGSSLFSGQTKLMQRPELVKTRRSATAAAAELERERSGERKKTTKGGEWERPRSCLFIKKGCLRRREKRGDKHYYPAAPTPRFLERSVKAKIRWRIRWNKK